MFGTENRALVMVCTLKREILLVGALSLFQLERFVW